jgi:hypothetical protein
LTFVSQFTTQSIWADVARKSATQLYESFEPRLNAREVVLLDEPLLEQQLLGLIWRGGKIDHPAGEHDDYANAVAGLTETLIGPNVSASPELITKCLEISLESEKSPTPIW